ncbi:MAG: kelch repeat-containing protein [Planctomycetota bacterium]
MPRQLPVVVFPLLLLSAPLAAQSWRQATPPHAPSARDGHALSYDAQAQRTVLFGGYRYSLDQHLADTWTFDGQDWTQIATAVAPPPRRVHGMCFDRQRGVTVLFGGFVGGSFSPVVYRDDTWEFDGAAWQQVTIPGARPSPRFTPIAFDENRGVVVLFGGNGNAGALADTWEFDGATWTQRTSPTYPPAHHRHQLAYDAARGVTVLQQSYTMGGPTVLQTWQWDGQTWTQIVTPTPAPLMSEPAMTYDRQRQVVLLVGNGFAGPAASWAFDGIDWQQLPATFGAARSDHAMAFDEARGAAVLFGGSVDSGAWIVEHDDTWQFGIWAEFSPFGGACGASLPALASASGAGPRSGTTMTTRLSLYSPGSLPVIVTGASDQSWQGTALPVDLSMLGLSGCQLRVGLDVVTVLADQGGQADLDFAVPAAPALHGATFFQQGAVFDAGLALAAVSNAAKLRVGL